MINAVTALCLITVSSNRVLNVYRAHLRRLRVLLLHIFLLFLLFPVLFSRLITVSRRLTMFARILVAGLFRRLLEVRGSFRRSLNSQVRFVVGFSQVGRRVTRVARRAGRFDARARSGTFVGILANREGNRVLPCIFLRRLNVLVHRVRPVRFGFEGIVA